MGRAPSLLLVTRVTMVSVNVLFVMVSVTWPSWVGTGGNWNSLTVPTVSGCLTLMTILELGVSVGCWCTKWDGIMAWNCSLVTWWGASPARATAFLRVGWGDGATFAVVTGGGGEEEVKNCVRSEWFLLGELKGMKQAIINWALMLTAWSGCAVLPCGQWLGHGRAHYGRSW